MTKQLDLTSYNYTQYFDDYETICKNIRKYNNNCNIVFTNGCFDILHVGHISTLNYCRNLSKKDGIVIVGINSDDSIKRIKGNNRPINTLENRANVLLNLRSVDYVIEFEEDTPQNLIQALQPNIIVKGGDYNQSQIVGADIARVMIAPYLQGNSTTNIINAIEDIK